MRLGRQGDYGRQRERAAEQPPTAERLRMQHVL
jgi:hypothetical protein